MNREYRDIDKETDVLSFPMFEREELEERKDLNEDILGDIVISLEKVKQQAQEYGHSFERELSYMIVHGFYHLLGYDHQTKDEEEIMFKKQEEVLEDYGIRRES